MAAVLCRTAFFDAARYDRPLVLRTQLDLGMNVNIQNSDQNTALILASLNKNVDCVRLLLKRKADTEIKNHRKDTALIVAAAVKCDPIVELLLDHGANVHAQNECGDTAFDNAVISTSKSTAEILLDHGAQINRKNKWGFTALHRMACGSEMEWADRQMITFLLKMGADKTITNNYNETALDSAKKYQRPDLVELLE